MKGFVPTPTALVDRMVEKLFQAGPPMAGSKLLDPGCGSGRSPRASCGGAGELDRRSLASLPSTPTLLGSAWPGQYSPEWIRSPWSSRTS